MSNLDLKGRKPDELIDRETCNEILLELKDTGYFDIHWTALNSFGNYMNWRANNKVFDNWVERGQVVMYEIDNSTLPKSWSEPFTESTISLKEKRYDIFRYPTRISVEYKHNGDYRSHNTKEKFEEIYQLSNDVYQRLKDYIGIDLIQDQHFSTNFQIDFMLSEIKLI